MSDPDDLLRKADAFLERYRPAVAAGPDIPLLTEVVELGEGGAPVPEEPAPIPETAPAERRDGLSEAQVREVEVHVRQQVFESLQPYIAGFLEEPLKVLLEDHVQRAVSAMAENIRTDIEMLVQDAVAKAVERELESRRGGQEPGDTQP
jgi:hypothetical protein